MNAEFAESFGAEGDNGDGDNGGSDGGLVDFSLALADVKFDDLEVLDVGDAAILVLVDVLEDELGDGLWANHLQELVGVIEQFDELFKSHESL